MSDLIVFNFCANDADKMSPTTIRLHERLSNYSYLKFAVKHQEVKI